MSVLTPVAACRNESTSLARYYPHRVSWPVMLGLMALLSLLIGWASCRSCGFFSRAYWASFLYSFCYATGLWLVNGYPAAWLNRRADWTQQPLLRFAWALAYSVGASFLVIFVVSAGFAVFYNHQLISSLSWQEFFVPLLFVVIISLFLHGRSFLLGWREAAIRVERVEKESAQAQADSLRRQVDPHFLFNSLNALTTLVEENDPARATRFIRQLAQVYRYVLDSQAREVVPLAEEMAFVDSYLHLQHTRLGAGLRVELDLPPAAALAAFVVPPLAVQLLLENALKHNATSQRDPLRIEVQLDAAARQLRVCNTLRPRSLAPGESTGLGLQNLRARYAFLSRQPVVVARTATEFVVTLPLLTMII